MRCLKRVSLFFLLVVLVLWSPVGRLVERGVDAHLAGMHRRQLANRNTALDRWQCRLLYGGIVTLGGLRYPEGAAVIDHYLHGGGRDLQLASDYICRSPGAPAAGRPAPGPDGGGYIAAAAGLAAVLCTQPVSATAGGPPGGYLPMDCLDPRPAARTVLDLGLLRFTVPDGLVHVLQARSYMARCEWFEESTPTPRSLRQQ